MKRKTFYVRLLLLFIITCFFHSAVLGQNKTVLQLHPQNPHYFLFRDKPAIILGSGEHYGSVVNLDFDYATYLKTLAADGLNHTRLFTGAYVEKSGDFGIKKNTLAPAEGKLLLPWKRSNTPGYSLGGNKFDLEQWNEAYFKRLKDFVAEAGRNNVIVEATLFSAHYGNGWNYSALNPQNNVNGTKAISGNLANTLLNGNILLHQERYVRKLVRELNSFENLYFEIQNEPWADSSDLIFTRNEYGPMDDWRSTLQVVSQRSNDWQQQVARWIKDEEKSLPNKHLISQNISNFFYPITDADSNVSIFNFHYALPQAATQNLHLQKAIGFNETGFAGKADSTYRRQAWRFLMSGGALFSHLDYSFSAGSEKGLDTAFAAPGGGSPALRRQFGFLKKFFSGLPFVGLLPDALVVQAAPGAQAWALSNNQSQWVIYLEPLAQHSYPLHLQLPAGRFKAQWYDALSGEALDQATVVNNVLPVPAGKHDKVVIIKAVGSK